MSHERRLPRISLHDIFTLRRRIWEGIAEFAGCIPTGDTADHLTARLQELLPRAQELALRRTIQCLPPTELSVKDVYTLAWRLAGNEKLLAAGGPATPWEPPGVAEWVPVQVLATRTHLKFHGGRRTRGIQLRLKALAGTCCTMTLSAWWSEKLVRFLECRLGFTRARGRRPRRDLTELTLLRFWVFVDPDRSAQRPRFQAVGCPPSLRTYNADIISRRRRIQWACPRNFSHECYQCPIGYRDCDVATHPHDFVWRVCGRCGAEQWHDEDPEWPATVCVQCQPLEELRLRKGRPR